MQEGYRLEAKKSLGQHFLNNARIPEVMADAAEVQEGDVVLEIGPGTGALTRTLLKKGAVVVGVEADERAIYALKELFSEDIQKGSLVLFHADIREVGLTAFLPHIQPSQYKVVANIPYYLSGMLFRIFLESDMQPTDLVFLVQREVAERIARDKKESLLSLSVKAFGEPKYIQTVGKGNFNPPPKVDSAVIAVRAISKKRLYSLPETFFFTVLHAGFASKRKQLLGNLTKLFPRERLVHIFSTLGMPEDIRGEDMSLSLWVKLTEALSLEKTTS